MMIVEVEGNFPGVPIGSEVPDLPLAGLDGSMTTLSALRGQPVFLSYFATF